MILAIDIGIKNLALCIMSSHNYQDFNTYKIHLWDVFDTLDSEDNKCQSLTKGNKICNKKCLYKYKDELEWKYCCKTHFPKNLKIEKENNVCKKKINDYLLQDIAKIVLFKIQEIYDNNIEFQQLKSIIIELQPKINQKMKFTSHIIYGKLVELYMNKNVTVRFVRAANKLKAYTGPPLVCNLKNPYAKRKWLSIQYIKWFLETKFNTIEKDKWLTHLNTHKKADDMSDTALMAINGLYGVPKKQKMNFKSSNIKN